MKKIIFLLPLLLLLISCSTSTVTTNVQKNFTFYSNPTVVLAIKNDSWNLEKSISSRIENLGFKLTENSNIKPDFYALVDYETYWDVVHQTFNHFQIVFIDTESEQPVAKSLYIGRFGFNGCEAALDLVFEDLTKKIKKAPNKPMSLDKSSDLSQ